MIIHDPIAATRKAILLNRSALISAWPRYFPRHDFGTLQLIPSWNEKAWAESARRYHEDRKRSMRQ